MLRMAVLLLQLQGHAGTEEVTVAVEALGPVVEAALVVARVEEAAVVVAVAICCTYNRSRACSSSRIVIMINRNHSALLNCPLLTTLQLALIDAQSASSLASMLDSANNRIKYSIMIKTGKFNSQPKKKFYSNLKAVSCN